MPLFQSICRRFLSMGSAYPTLLTPAWRIRDLQQRIAPVKTQHELIRLGPSRDGGYLVPNDIDGIIACFSPGVAAECGFELDCVKRDMEVFMADFSVDESPVSNERFHFLKKFVGANTRNEFVSVDTWVQSMCPQEGDLLLQMDIEGFEYESLIAASETILNRFRIIVIELHRFHLLFSEPVFCFYSSFFDKLLKQHTCVHLHPNNYLGCEVVNGIRIPKLMEATFFRNDRIYSTTPVKSLPVELDADNVDKNTILLDHNWLKLKG